MRIGIIEYGAELANVFEKEISAKIAGVEVKKKAALDMFDVLAFTKKMVDFDHLVIIVGMIRENKDVNAAFFDGLAMLETETGKNIFKCIYYEDEDGEALVKELVETFVNYLYYPEKLKAKPAEVSEETPEGFP
jgi:riboflavin synthase